MRTESLTMKMGAMRTKTMKMGSGGCEARRIELSMHRGALAQAASG